MSSSPCYLDPIVIKLLAGETVLDVGCGYGRWGALIRCNFWEAFLPGPPHVDGIDAFAPNVELCSRQGSYRQVWQHVLPAPLEGKWDTVLACEIIEHIAEDDLDKAFSVLEGAANRRVIFSTPNFPAFRGGGETAVGYNKYEAHLSYVTREEFRRRGYKLIGAGFGHPQIEFTEAIYRYNPDLIDVFQSLSRAFPAIAHVIVAYKDIGSSKQSLEAFSRGLEGLSLGDVSLGRIGDQIVTFDSKSLKLVLADGFCSDSLVFVMNKEGGAVALTAESGLLTFTPQGRVHRQASVIDIWERLDLQEAPLTHHGLRLNAYFDQEPVEDVVLMPPPLKIVVEPWWTDLIRSIGAPANQVARLL